MFNPENETYFDDEQPIKVEEVVETPSKKKKD